MGEKEKGGGEREGWGEHKGGEREGWGEHKGERKGRIGGT